MGNIIRKKFTDVEKNEINALVLGNYIGDPDKIKWFDTLFTYHSSQMCIHINTSGKFRAFIYHIRNSWGGDYYIAEIYSLDYGTILTTAKAPTRGFALIRAKRKLVKP